MVVSGSLALWGVHPGQTQDPHQGQSGECVHSDLTAQLAQLTPSHPDGLAWGGLGPAGHPHVGGTHSKSVSFFSSVTGLKATDFF